MIQTSKLKNKLVFVICQVNEVIYLAIRSSRPGFLLPVGISAVSVSNISRPKNVKIPITKYLLRPVCQ